tara:strand:+ start:3908 stop:4114 length:207 start_codon:yes stop_codon:yes gene_type:complete
MTPQTPLESPTTMDPLSQPYDILKEAIIADAEYWNGIQTPYDTPKRPYLGEDETMYDDYPDVSDGEEW